MRSTQTCPKCSGRKFAVSARFQVPEVGECPAIMAHTVTRSGMESIRAGKFQTWMCLSCGYTEFYAYDLGDLAQIEQAVGTWSDQMRIVDATAPQKGPYR